MSKLGEALIMMKIKASTMKTKVLKDESGDTNFISIAIIIAIVLVLAAAFFTFGDKAMETISKNVTDFIDNPQKK